MNTTTTVSGTLRAQEHGHQPCICYGISAFESNAMKLGNPHSGIYEAETARTLDNNGGSPACNQGGMAIVQGFRHWNGAKSGGLGVRTEQAPTLGCDGNAAVFDARGNGDGNLAPTITGDHQNRITDYTAIVASPDIVGTLMSRDYKGPGRTDSIDRLVTQNTIVRRLTPLECTRLQGFPDGWVDIGDWTDSKGKKHKDTDSPKYKALGNSIAIPPWMYVLSRLNRFCTEHTMASLFDGIGGFALIWETLNGWGSCIWASEIEEFPMAVTKLRFGSEA